MSTSVFDEAVGLSYVISEPDAFGSLDSASSLLEHAARTKTIAKVRIKIINFFIFNTPYSIINELNYICSDDYFKEEKCIVSVNFCFGLLTPIYKYTLNDVNIRARKAEGAFYDGKT